MLPLMWPTFSRFVWRLWLGAGLATSVWQHTFDRLMSCGLLVRPCFTLAASFSILGKLENLQGLRREEEGGSGKIAIYAGGGSQIT